MAGRSDSRCRPRWTTSTDKHIHLVDDGGVYYKFFPHQGLLAKSGYGPLTLSHHNLSKRELQHQQDSFLRCYMVMRGSNASRSPSPMKLILSTASTIMMPGGTHIQGICSRMVIVWASCNMPPQLGVGG